MMRRLLLPFLLLASPALAEELPTPPPAPPPGVTITMTTEEAQALVQVLDVAVKACGLNCASIALTVVAKIQVELEKSQ